MRPKPIVRCLVALTYGAGHLWGSCYVIRLENVPKAIAMGLSVVGPDPDDMCDLAAWEKEQEQWR